MGPLHIVPILLCFHAFVALMSLLRLVFRSQGVDTLPAGTMSPRGWRGCDS